MRSRHGSHAAVAMLLLAGGCGGGGSSGSSGPDPIAITFSPSPLATAFNQGDFVLPVTLNVTLSRLPQGTIFVVLGLDQPVLSNTTLIVSQIGPTTFSVPLTPSCTLAPGSHAGSMTLRLCTDQACNGSLPLTGNVLPYAFTVGPGHVLTAKVGGVAVPGIISHCTSSFFTAKVGQVVEVTSSVDVTWATGIGTSAGVPTVSSETSTTTTWSATVGEQSGGNIPGVTYGVVFVHATPTGGGPTLDANVTVVGGG